MMKRILLLTVLLPAFVWVGSAEIDYPWKDTYIGALDAADWAGLAVAPHVDSAFAFRLLVSKGEETAQGLDFMYLVSEIGPHSPDGRYACVKFDLSLPFGRTVETPILKKPSPKSNTLVLEWSRQDERTVIGRLQIPKDIQVQLVSYFPWKTQGRYQILSDGQVRGESMAVPNFQYLLWTSRPGLTQGADSGTEVALMFPAQGKKEVYFVAAVGEDLRILGNRIYRYKNEKTIQRFLSEEARIYDENRVQIRGRFRGAAEAMTNNLFWSALYQPDSHRFYIPGGRDRILSRPDGTPFLWTIMSRDAFFNALVSAVESTKHARDVLRSVLETQFPNGNLPQWRAEEEGSPDRSQPPIGSYVVLKLFWKTGDVELLRFAYPYLSRWHSFWRARRSNGLIRRDGNGDGLLEWGSDSELVQEDAPPEMNNDTDKGRARWESAKPDLPTWDEAGYDRLAGTMTMNCLDLNCLYALDAWCLSQMAGVLELVDENRDFRNEYEALKLRINDTFWDSRRGFYFDRHWDGRFSEKMTAASFLPLLARIPDEDKIRQMRRHLLNREEFWGDYVLPSVSRQMEEYKQQQRWRGAIWPPLNYLVYQGLKACGLDAEAYEFASKSADLFLLSWENFQLCPENFDARTGEATGRRHQSWGPLMALIALEEYIDITPWEGFRFGMIKPEKSGEVRRVAIQGRRYDVKVSPKEIKLKEEGKEILKANGGAVFRRFLYKEQEVSFEVMTLEERKIRIRFLSKGKYQYSLDNQLKRIFEGDSVEIRVPQDPHRVDILLIEKKD